LIDIHSHILPNVDDGSQSLETTLKMLEIAKEDGTKIIYATPHYITGFYEKTFEEVSEKADELNSLLYEKGIDIKVLPGQEIFIDNYTLRDLEEEKIQPLSGTSYMLIEFSMDTLPKNALEIVYEIGIKGITPIIAHPERYEYFIKDTDIINSFIDEGCLFQVNSQSLLGTFGKKAKKNSEYLIKNGIIGFIGSDAHGLNKRTPELKKGIEAISKINKTISDSILENNRNILQAEYEPIRPQKIKKRSKIFEIFH